MPSDYLLKTEPSAYSFEDLKRDGSTLWDGVHNPVALRNLRAMKPGDRLIIYETGDRKSASVGTASVVSVDNSDPKNSRSYDSKLERPSSNRSRWRKSGPTLSSGIPLFVRQGSAFRRTPHGRPVQGHYKILKCDRRNLIVLTGELGAGASLTVSCGSWRCV